MKLYPVKFFKLPIQQIKALGEGLSEVTLDTSKTTLRFLAGQYLRITLPQLSPDVAGGNTRDFSIASSPNHKKSLTFAFRHSKSHFKTTLLKARKGSILEVQGPLGSFILPEDPRKNLIFLAGGIGITPMLSMLRFATENKLVHQIQLVYANSKEKTIPYLKELQKLEKENPAFELFLQESPQRVCNSLRAFFFFTIIAPTIF